MSELGPRDQGHGEDRWTVPGEMSATYGDLDAALGRLEDVLLGLPYDRALPDLADILSRAKVTEEHLRLDDRALKVLHEAVLARPLSDIDEVAALKTTVELLTLEVQVLTERLQDPSTRPDDVAIASTRLASVRSQLTDLRKRL